MFVLFPSSRYKLVFLLDGWIYVVLVCASRDAKHSKCHLDEFLVYSAQETGSFLMAVTGFAFSLHVTLAARMMRDGVRHGKSLFVSHMLSSRHVTRRSRDGHLLRPT